jgi:hypothetical protein
MTIKTGYDFSLKPYKLYSWIWPAPILTTITVGYDFFMTITWPPNHMTPITVYSHYNWLCTLILITFTVLDDPSPWPLHLDMTTHPRDHFISTWPLILTTFTVGYDRMEDEWSQQTSGKEILYGQVCQNWSIDITFKWIHTSFSYYWKLRAYIF